MHLFKVITKNSTEELAHNGNDLLSCGPDAADLILEERLV